MEINYRDKLIIEKLNNPTLLEAARKLNNQGFTLKDEDCLYLKIHDSFIHDLYPLINDSNNLAKPNYFCEQDYSGAHISLIYPDDDVFIKNEDINIFHSFEIVELIKTRIKLKEYYVLMVSSPSLAFLRKKYNLPSILSFKGYEIGLHITIATSTIGK